MNTPSTPPISATSFCLNQIYRPHLAISMQNKWNIWNSITILNHWLVTLFLERTLIYYYVFRMFLFIFFFEFRWLFSNISICLHGEGVFRICNCFLWSTDGWSDPDRRVFQVECIAQVFIRKCDKCNTLEWRTTHISLGMNQFIFYSNV